MLISRIALCVWNVALLWNAILPVSALRAQSEPGQTSSILGRVISAVSGEGVRKVNVTLRATRGKQESLVTQTDDSGRFTFRDLAPGGYRLTAERNGYQRQAYGAKLNPASGTVLGLSPGQDMHDLTFKLAPDAVISGRVLDAAGEPVPGVGVTAFRKGYLDGQMQWAPVNGTGTNDRGEFRLAGLRAGHYLVCANALNTGYGLMASDEEHLPERPDTAYFPTCYGNATEMINAVAVEVRQGEDRRGTDIQLVRGPAIRIRVSQSFAHLLTPSVRVAIGVDFVAIVDGRSEHELCTNIRQDIV